MRKLLLVLLGFAFPVVAYSQQPTSGMPPFGSFQTSGFDAVDRYNMNANFAIPIVSSAGRVVPFNFAVIYDSSVWTHYSVSYWTANIGGGWKTNVPTGLLTYSTSTGRCDTPPPYHSYTRYFNFRYTDAAGTTHPIPLSYYGPNVCGMTPVPPRSAYASDASGYYAYASTAQIIKITAKSGTVDGTPQIIDTNGNVVSSTVNGSETDWTDSAGHVMLKVITSSTQILYEYPDTSGTYQITTLKLQSYNVKTNFACSGITEYTGTQSLPYELDLANGQKYTFSYETTPGNTGYVTGRVQRVTLPTGGYYEYDYGATNDGIYCSDGSTVSMNRVVNDGTNSNTWQYSRAANGSNQITTVTDPASNAATYTFNASAQETAEKHYQGSPAGTLLRTVNTTWASNGTPATAIAILEDNSTQSEVETSYDNYGNLLTLKEHDWGTGTPGSILRTTTNTYLSTSPYITANILDRPTLTTIADSTGTVKSRTVITYDDSGYINTPCITGAAQHDDSGHGCSYTVRGDPTTVTRYTDANTPSGPITKHNTYDSLGNVVGADVDCCRHKQFNFSATTQYAYPDSTVIGLAPNQFTTSYTYSAYNGLLATAKDPNNQPTSYAYDNMLRPSSVSYPDAGLTSYGYSTQYGGTYVQITEKMDASHNRVSYIWSDGIGRQARAAVTNGETQPYDETQNTCFNSIGLVSLQGYPFQDGGWGSPISCSVPDDSYTYDALSRPKMITHTDGSSGSISYTTNCATATDEQGKSRKVCSDGLGRLTSVVENPGGLNYNTAYAYDALSNLTTVTQGAETRTFAYDGLSRLTSATNPESGATSYTYDSYSHVATRTDARSIITTYSYDAAERLASKTYSDGTPTAGFYYDQSSWNGITLSNGIGRLTSQGVWNGSQWVASSAFSYDGLGRVTNNPQFRLTINSTLQVPYTYDLVGDMLTYGNGGASWLTFTQSFNIGGRVTQLTSNWVDSQHPGTLVSGAHYNGAGGITSYLMGNNLTETAAYNGLVQPCRMNVNSSGTLLSSCTASVPSGNVLDLTTGFNYGSGDNGNVTSWAAVGQQTFNRSYTYDGVNRLYTMSAPGSTCSGLSWSYDQWGNRTAQNVTGGTCGSSQLTFNSYNHVTNSGFQYDAAGNMTHDAGHSYTYDAENRITKVDGGSTATYGYDADGRRASRVVAGVETDYIYDLSGHVVADYGGGCGATCWRVGYVYLNGQVLAEYFGGTYFVHTDHLGSTRLLTNYPTPTVAECDDYYPFGEQASCGGTSTTTHKFTGYERDSETGLDNARARYNSSTLGRFMSPDPIGNFVADATNPQTWNLYAYVLNNPLSFTDPTGTETNDRGDVPNVGGGDDTPHQLPADPTAGAPVGTPADLGGVCTTASTCVVEVHADLPPDVLTSDDLSLGGGPASVASGGGGRRKRSASAMQQAELIIFKPDCANFIEDIVLNAYDAEGDFDFGAVLQTAAQAPDAVGLALGETTYTSSSANPQSGNYTEYASTAAGSRAVTLYAGYSQLAPLQQAQTLIHEAVHDAFGLTDQQIASAVTGNVYANTPAGTAQASDAFHKALQKNCN